MPYVKRHSGFVQDVADFPDMVCLAIPTIAANFLGISQVTPDEMAMKELGWRSAGAAADAAARAEALGTILGRKLRAGKQDAGHTLEKTAVTA